MSEEKTQVRKALVEAIAAQKLIEQKLAKATSELATWKTRAASAHDSANQLMNHAEVEKDINNQIKTITGLIAELETDRLSQNDLEKQLRATLFRLENSVQVNHSPNIPSLEGTRDTITRMEGKIFEQEARAELSSNEKERQLKASTEAASIEDELNALKQTMHKKEE